MVQNQKQEFIEWLNKNLPASASKYSGAIDTITKELMDCNLIEKSIYSINDIEEIKQIIDLYLGVQKYYQKNKTGNNMYSASLKKYIQFLRYQELNKFDLYIAENNIDDEIMRIEYNLEKINETERLSLINFRIGQSEFKDGLVKKYKKCLLCSINMPELLIASHIKPWAKSNDKEKLDLNNGLLLCCLHDKLFDIGFISFDISGKIIISTQVNEELYDDLKINKNQIIEVNKKILRYLVWHRENKLK